jgi:hypothetical protein
MTVDEAARLARGDSVEYYNGRLWMSVEVLEPLRNLSGYPGLAVRITNGTYETEAAPSELRP